MRTLDFSSLSPAEHANWLQYAVAPRPICFASTIDKNGRVNLSPFSYFNIVSANPPVCLFSPLRRLRDGTEKHSVENVRETLEVVINIADYNMVHQLSLASCEYEKGVNEFEKAGFTMQKSERVKPPRVAGAPVQMECRVQQVISLGTHPGAGQMVLAEVLLMHLNENIVHENGMQIDQQKLDLVARLGGDWYCRVTPQNLFEVPKPNRHLGMGVNALPEMIRYSAILTGNHLGQLGNLAAFPAEEEVEEMKYQPEIKEILDATIGDRQKRIGELHRYAAQLLDNGTVKEAMKILLIEVY